MGNEVKNSSKYYKIYQLYRNKHMKNVFSEEGNSGAHNLNASLRLFLHKCLSGCYRSKYASGLYFRLKLVSYKNQTKHHYAYLIVGSSYWCLSANCHLYRHYHTLKKRGGVRTVIMKCPMKSSAMGKRLGTLTLAVHFGVGL